MQISGYVTVIVPVHNGALTIRRALEAIADQTYRPLEVVVVDDGSDDPTPGWVRAFRKAHPELPVTVQTQAREGLASALRAGLALARGEFVAFCHQADEWRPEKLAMQIKELRRHPRASYVLADWLERHGDRELLKPAPEFKAELLYEPVPFSSLVARRDAVTSAGRLHEAPEGVIGHELVSRMAIQAPGVAMHALVATCHRKERAPLPLEAMVATWDRLREAGAVSERHCQVGMGKLYALHGWQALLADEPGRARDVFKTALSAAPYRPDAWIGLVCAQVDQVLFKAGLLKPQEGTLAHADR